MKPVTRLRISYWTGAVADGLVAAAMLSQAFLGYTSPLTGYEPETPYRYAMGLAGSLMLGWTLLLLWADRDPVRRRGVLPITVVVIVGLMGSSVVAVANDFMPLVPMLVLTGILIGLIALFTTSYILSRREGPGN